jgi:hypothetical protein
MINGIRDAAGRRALLAMADTSFAEAFALVA